MKLNIGQNLRSLRRSADMTQDELAVKLGVTFQTVSRWENGGSYPDIEFLPAIAEIFHVTVDHLLGDDREMRREQLKDLTKRLDQAVQERENGTVTELLREFRRDLRLYAGFTAELQYAWLTLRQYSNEAPPEVLEEVRQLYDEFCAHVPEPDRQGNAFHVMTLIEDDEHIREFLKRNNAFFSNTIEEILFMRYSARDEMRKREYIEQVELYTLLTKLLKHSSNHHEANLTYLHALHDVCPLPEYPVSADGSPDLWIDTRMWLGMQIARRYVLWKNDVDRAFDYANDAVSLLEKLMAIPDGETLTLQSRTWILPEFTVEASCEYEKKERVAQLKYSGGLYDRSNMVWPSTYLSVFRDAFESVQDDPRYAAMEARITALTKLTNGEQPL